MARIKIRLADNIARVVFVDPDATVGATIGVDLKLPDGRVATVPELQRLLGVSAAVASTADHRLLAGLALGDDHPQYTRKDTLTTRGDIYYRNATTVARLGLGTDRQFLRAGTLDPAWETVSPTVTLGTDLSGSATFTNLASATLNATIVNDAVTNTKLADMAQSTIKGRAEGAGTGDPQDLTPTQVASIIDGETITWTGGHVFEANFNIGDPGTESGAVLLDGVSVTAPAKINEFGGGKEFSLVVHRHANAAGRSGDVLFSRARGTTSTHDDVQSGDQVGSLTFAAWHTDSYYTAAKIVVDLDGSPGAGDMPGLIKFYTSPPGGVVPVEHFRISQNGAFGLSGNNYGTSGQTIISAGSGAAPAWGELTNTGLADMAQSTIKGRAEGAGTGDPQDLTPTQVVSIIDGENATWTGDHVFTAGVLLESNNPRLEVQETGVAADTGRWDMRFNASTAEFRTRTDADGAGVIGWRFPTRSSIALSSFDVLPGNTAPIVRLGDTTTGTGTVFSASNAAVQVSSTGASAAFLRFGANPVIIFARINGTPASPAAVGASQIIGQFNYLSAIDTTPSVSPVAQFRAVSTEAHTSLVRGTRLEFLSVATGTTSLLTTFVALGNQVQLLSASAAAPALTFQTDTDTGIYNSAANTLGISTGGTLRLDVNTVDIIATLPYRGPDGTAAAPAFSFSADTNIGMYRVGADELGISTAGTERLRIGASGEWGLGGANYGTVGQSFSSNGSAAAPTWQNASTFTGYSNTSIPAGNTVANTTTETAFSSSYTIAANTLRTGSVIRIRAYGTYSTDALLAPTLQLRVKIGGTTWLDTGAFATVPLAPMNRGWTVDAQIIVHSTGGSGVADAQGLAQFATSATATTSVHLENTSTFTLDTTAAQAVTLTIDWGTADADNTITLRQLVLQVENP